MPTTDGHVPVIDLNKLLELKEGDEASQKAYDEECAKVAKALHEYSILIVRDPRVSEADNNGCVRKLARAGVQLMHGRWCGEAQVPGLAGGVLRVP